MTDYVFQGWMRTATNPMRWLPVCAANTVSDCTKIMEELKIQGNWYSSLVLPFDETPVRSKSIHHGGL